MGFRFVLGLAAVLAGLATAPSSRGGEQLNLFIWSEYIPDEVLREFEKRHGCKVVVDLYEEAESMMAKLQAAGGAYDVIVPPDHTVAALIQLRLIAPLDLAKIPNLKNLDPKFASPPFDPGNRHTVAYQWGTVGVYARKDPAAALEESWSVFFDPAKQRGDFMLIDSMRDLIGAGLKHGGHSLNSTNPRELKEVRDLLTQAKRRAKGFVGSVGAKNAVLGKTARYAIAYNGEAARGMAEDPETHFFIPKEGSQIWMDNLAVVRGSKKKDLTEKFLNFVLEPEIGAKISNYTQFSTPNAAARPLIEKALLENPAIYPPAEVLGRLEFLKDLGAQSRLYDQVWTQIKSN